MRLKEFSNNLPKPLVNIGNAPLLHHIMDYYSHFGFHDFILCLGYKADMIKKYFMEHDNWVPNKSNKENSSKHDGIFHNKINDWNITFLDTGIFSNIGQRLKAVEAHLDDEEMFMANYADVLTDLSLPDFLDYFSRQGKTGIFLGVRPHYSFHVASIENSGLVNAIQPVTETNMWINGGYFIFRREIFQYIKNGEELVEEPFQRLIAAQELISLKYDGFWACMDTFKDKQVLEDLYRTGSPPWQVWKSCQTRDFKSANFLSAIHDQNKI